LVPGIPDHLRLTVPLHRALHKSNRSPAIPAFGGENFKHLAFVINYAPQIMRLAIDLYENLI